MEEYLKRNKVQAQTHGVKSGIEKILKRLHENKRKQKWLIESLEKALEKMPDIIKSATEYRDELGVSVTVTYINENPGIMGFKEK